MQQHSSSSTEPVNCSEPAVLEAAALDWQPSSGGSGGEGPPPRRRGAKPKYICATQEEAVAKRWVNTCRLCQIWPEPRHTLPILCRVLLTEPVLHCTIAACQMQPHGDAQGWRVCCRRDRNRQTALATYYRRKARIAELRSTLADLTAEHAALESLADMAEASGDCAGALGPCAFLCLPFRSKCSAGLLSGADNMVPHLAFITSTSKWAEASVLVCRIHPSAVGGWMQSS
jgi:hypothetical protein